MNVVNVSVLPPVVAMTCGNCGGRQFGVWVTTQGNAARVYGAECNQCRKKFRVDDAAFLEGTGKLQT